MVITVSREFGSGGRELARRLADELGYSYFDNELIQKTAQERGLDESFVHHVAERGTTSFYSTTIASRLSSGTMHGALVAGTLSRVLEEAACEGDCVIVGRAADAILSHLRPLRIFVYADKQSKVERCLSRRKEDEAISAKEIEKRMKAIDKGREDFHALFSDRKWGDKACYDLCVNTSGKRIGALVPALAAYAKAWGGWA